MPLIWDDKCVYIYFSFLLCYLRSQEDLSVKSVMTKSINMWKLHLVVSNLFHKIHIKQLLFCFSRRDCSNRSPSPHEPYYSTRTRCSKNVRRRFENEKYSSTKLYFNVRSLNLKKTSLSNFSVFTMESCNKYSGVEHAAFLHYLKNASVYFGPGCNNGNAFENVQVI